MGVTCFLVTGNPYFMPGLPNGGIGAMWWREHGRDPARDTQPRPMPHLAVLTPAGVACLDCPASPPQPPGSYWTRIGTPPRVTVSPSLNVNRDEWHGFLRDGVLDPA